MEASNVSPEMASSFDAAVESLIFASDEPISIGEIARAWSESMGMDAPDEATIRASVDRINAELDGAERPYRIEEWGGGFRFATRKEVAPFLRALFVTDRQRKLSRTLMETLAIMAYRQPVSRSEIEFIRGVDCDYALRKLLEYGLIDVVGRSERVGRPLLYGTTPRFLELFGMSAIDDLPNLRELESILDDPAFQKEKARLLMTTAVQLPLAQVDESSQELRETDPAEQEAEEGEQGAPESSTGSLEGSSPADEASQTP